jgi:hypothetical protein
MAIPNQYVIFNVSELDKIDFSQVYETSAETVRTSVDNTLTFVKWTGDIPSCVQSLTTKGDVLTHEEMLVILSTDEWTKPLPPRDT